MHNLVRVGVRCRPHKHLLLSPRTADIAELADGERPSSARHRAMQDGEE